MLTMAKEKDFIVVYKSKEHYEVLGYVKAPSLKLAIVEAHTKLLPEAKYYEVSDAEVSEIMPFETIIFDLN